MKRETYPGIIVGAITALALIVYFLVMKAAGLVHITELRLFNFFILFAGIYWSMKKDAAAQHGSFFENLGRGCTTVITAVSLFAIFIFVFLRIDSGTLEQLKGSLLIGQYITPETAAIGVFAEGLSSGIIMAYVFLSYTTKENA